MRSLAEPLIALIVAVVLQIIWRSTPSYLNDLFNFLSVGVIYIAASRGERVGAVVGSLTGLIQDSLTLRVLGLAGLTKTCLGFGVGLAFRKLNLQPFERKLLAFTLAAFLETLIWSGLAFLIFAMTPPAWLLAFWLQPLTSGFVASLCFQLRNCWATEESA